MNSFDGIILHFFNQFAGQSLVFDYLMVYVTGSNLCKAAPFIAMFWAWWAVESPDQKRRRELVLATLSGAAFAILFARVLALCLPYRIRPFTDPALHFVQPLGSETDKIDSLDVGHWSSFPSDHAALFFALTAGCFLISRRIGWVALFYTFFVVILPRIYLGLHAPTDLIVGGIIGWVLVEIFRRDLLRQLVSNIAFRWLAWGPLSFHFCFFLASYQFVVLFADVRLAGGYVKDMLNARAKMTTPRVN